MNYFKVKPSADQTRKKANKTDILVANELYTEKELKRFVPIDSSYVQSHFEKVSVPKNKTYFLFGARFSR